MTRVPRVSGKDLLAALQRGGWELKRVRGSHHYLWKPGSPGLVTVPVHGNEILPVGTLISILRQASLDVEELLGLL